MKLTENQRRVLAAMKERPNASFTADRLNATIATMQSLQRAGMVSGVFGATAMFGARRGMEWKLTDGGREVQL